MRTVALALALAGCGAGLHTSPTPTATSEPETAVRASWVGEDDPLAIAEDTPIEHPAGRELVPQWGHTAGVRALQWLPSGPLAVLDDLGHLALLEPSSGERLLWERPVPPGPWEEPFEIDASGRWLRVGANVHDLRTGDERTLPVALPDGALAAASPDLRALAWTVRDPGGSARLAVAEADGTTRLETSLGLDRALGVVWSPTARTIVVASQRALELVSATSGEVLRHLEPDEPSEEGLAFAFRPSGGALAILLAGDLVVLDPRDGSERARVTGIAPARTWAELRWSADGGRLALARREDEDALVAVFDAHDGSRVGEVRVPFGLPSEAVLSPDARFVAVGTSDGRVHVHEAEGGAEILLVDSGRTAGSPPFTFDPRARFLAVAGDEAIDVWDLELREEIGGFYQPGSERHLVASRGLEGSLGILAADEDGSYLWTPSAFRMDERCPYGGTVRVDDEGTVRVVGATAICDLSHGITVRPGWWIRAASPDGRLIVDANGGLFVEDALTGERRATLALDAGERPPCSTSLCGLPVAVSDGGERVAVARRSLLRVFDGRTGAVRARATIGERTSVLRFAPGGRTLVHVGSEGALAIFDSASLTPRLERSVPGPLAEAFSPEGDLHAHATSASLVLVPLRGRRSTPAEVALVGADWAPSEIVFVDDDRLALLRHDPATERERVEIRARRDGALAASAEADAIAVLSTGGIVTCDGRRLVSIPLDAAGALGAGRELGGCFPDARLGTTTDGRFVYLADDEGLRVIRTADGAHVSLHLVDAGWDVTAAIVRDETGRWDDGGYFDRPFLLRGDGEIPSATLEEARSSYVPGLAGYFARGEAPPIDEAAQPADGAP